MDVPVRRANDEAQQDASPENQWVAPSTSTKCNSQSAEDAVSSTRQSLTTGEPDSELEVPDSSSPEPQPERDKPPPYSIYSIWEKRLVVLEASLSAFFSPLTAMIYLPALETLAADFGVSSAKINLTVTTYMIFQGITPMFVGSLADAAGRRPAFVVCFVIYVAANIGLALSPTYAALLVLRCLQSAGSSATVALSQAVVADITTSAERGSYVGMTVIPVVLAPSLGPVIGGLLSQNLGWRFIFWFLAVAASFNLTVLLFFFPETCRTIVGDGSIRPHPIYRTFWQMLKDWRKRARGRDTTSRLTRTATTSSSCRRPRFKLAPPKLLGSLVLLFQKELGLLLTYSAITFSGSYAVTTSMPSQLQAKFGFNDMTVGLMYLPMAGGSIVVALVMGPLLDWNYRRHAARLGMSVDTARNINLAVFPIERARLEIGLPLVTMTAFVITGWGWALQAESTHVAVLCVLLFLIGVGLVGFNNCASTLIIDVHPGQAGAAVAANNLTRCLLGAVASAVIVPLIKAIGSGWAFTVIGSLYLAFLPAVVLIMRHGLRWRAEAEEAGKKQPAMGVPNPA